VCVAGEGAAPPQDCGGALAFMANRQYSAGLCRVHPRRELDELMEEFEDEDSQDYHPGKFERRRINRALGKLASGSYEEALDEIHGADSDPIAWILATQRSSRHD
jgi:hypothetical protein